MIIFNGHQERLSKGQVVLTAKTLRVRGLKSLVFGLKENCLPKKYEEMTKEEKLEALDKIMAGRASRKGLSSSRRKAVTNLIAAHQDEYAALLKAAGGKAPVKKV